MSTAKNLFSAIEIPEIHRGDFDFIATAIFNLAGIHLPYNDKNVALVQNRMAKLMRKHHLGDFHELTQFLDKNLKNTNVKNDFISCLTTNKTDFYREAVHFDILLKEVKKALAEKAEAFIWSSACSIGAEPYTMAIHLKENLTPIEFDRVKILATDIDVTCLNAATEGFFTEAQMEGLNPQITSKYFNELAGLYYVHDDLKKKIHFSQLNLFNYPYSISRKFDVIFCRNVLIYFTPEDRNTICHNLANYLKPDGALILGLSETGSISVPQLKLISNATYQRIQS